MLRKRQRKNMQLKRNENLVSDQQRKNDYLYQKNNSKFNCNDGKDQCIRIPYGSRGEEVENVQRKLLDLTTIYNNLPVVTIDGIFSDNMQRAVKKFQQLNALEITGDLNAVTLGKINQIHESNSVDFEVREVRQENGVNYLNQSKNQLEKGDTGQYVVMLQKYMNIVSKRNTSIPSLVVDGYYGQKTEMAVKEFQNLFQLQVDGKVDDITWNVLYQETLKD